MNDAEGSGTPSRVRFRNVSHRHQQANLSSVPNASKSPTRMWSAIHPDKPKISKSSRLRNISAVFLVAEIEVIHTIAAKPKPQQPLHHQNLQSSTQHRQRASYQNPSKLSTKLLQLLFFAEYQFEAIPPKCGGAILITKQRLQKNR
jgi:hypothetical protein